MKLLSANGGSKKKISNFLNCFLFKKSFIFSFKTVALFSMDKADKFLFKISTAFLFFSTKIILSAPLDMHSNPKEPIPE